MIFKFKHYIEDTDWDEYSSQGDAYLEVFFASVIILVVAIISLFFLPYI